MINRHWTTCPFLFSTRGFISNPSPQALLPGLGLLAFGYIALTEKERTDDAPTIFGGPLTHLLLLAIPLSLGTYALLDTLSG